LRTSGDAEIIKCEFCGVSQQKVDIEKYISQLRADVYSWVRSIVPTAAVGVTMVDPLARAQIFEQTIRGQVTGRLGSINMALLKVGSAPLFLPPYTHAFVNMEMAADMDPKEYLSQAAKFQGLTSFAQSDDQNAFITGAEVSSETLGYITNVLRIYTEPVQRSYRTVSKNFESAAVSLERDPTRSGAALRMRGLASLAEGTALMIEGELTGAQLKFADAGKLMVNASTEVMRQVALASWFPAIKAEIGMVDSMRSVLQGLSASRSSPASQMDALRKFEKYVRNFEAARAGAGPILYTESRLESESFKGVASFFRDASISKGGTAAANVVGTGAVYVGCWLSELTYSFETGALFMKKGQAVQERFLVSGLFMALPEYITSEPQALVTDIFSVRSQSSFGDRFMGREKTLTTGAGYAFFGNVKKTSFPGSSAVVPPLCTRVEAEKMANIYVEKVRQKLQGKLRVGLPSVTQVVYAGGSINNGWLEIQGLPASMSPYVGDQKTVLEYAV
jgi:hypothetical protein